MASLSSQIREIKRDIKYLDKRQDDLLTLIQNRTNALERRLSELVKRIDNLD
ncbi:MAG: hypothetical protein JRI72_06740 [Deltaproteobacteria bacterium]|nr:hypothetical protein [Deltaproteobacteria bacterium]